MIFWNMNFEFFGEKSISFDIEEYKVFENIAVQIIILLKLAKILSLFLELLSLSLIRIEFLP